MQFGLVVHTREGVCMFVWKQNIYVAVLVHMFQCSFGSPARVWVWRWYLGNIIIIGITSLTAAWPHDRVVNLWPQDRFRPICFPFYITTMFLVFCYACLLLVFGQWSCAVCVRAVVVHVWGRSGSKARTLHRWWWDAVLYAFSILLYGNIARTGLVLSLCLACSEYVCQRQLVGIWVHDRNKLWPDFN